MPPGRFRSLQGGVTGGGGGGDGCSVWKAQTGGEERERKGGSEGCGSLVQVIVVSLYKRIKTIVMTMGMGRGLCVPLHLCAWMCT